jgi:ATP-dependent Clp protease ATP-binding subunit ClpA
MEIRQVVDILTRRRQNNPILTGEAGVGKTAVVEGFALRVVQGDVPPPLKNVTSAPSIWRCCRPAPASRASSRTGSRA